MGGPGAEKRKEEKGESKKKLSFPTELIWWIFLQIPLWYLQLLGEPEKEGWLIKKGGIGGALTKRWFVLIGPLLFYFSSEAADSRAKGVVPLYESEVMEHTVPDKELQKYEKKSQKGGLRLGSCWAIRTRMREFVISSDTSAERSEWMKACEENGALQIEDDGNNAKTSIAMLRKLLLPGDAMRKELEQMLGGSERGKALTLPPEGTENQEDDDEVEENAPGYGSVLVGGETDDGAVLGNSEWRFDPYLRMLRSVELETDGKWPFGRLEQGLAINVQYSWNEGKLSPMEGSGSKGHWDGRVFRWYCLPHGSPRLVYEYSYVESSRRFESDNGELPVWVLDDDVMRNFNGVNVREFPDIAVDGNVPAIVALVVAMHKFQWKCEGQWSSK